MWRGERSRKLSRSGRRIDFKFSDVQAIQVPKGWDKLLVSVISVETGKTIAKSNKSLVKNGICQWTESLSESLWISRDDTSKELEEHLLKLVVSMGSARSGILGEVTVNMAQFFSSRASELVSLPLRKCNFGTILEVQIQCSTPRTNLRVEESRSSNSEAENQGEDYEGTKSTASVVSVTRSMKSAISHSTQDLGSPTQLEKLESSYSEFNSAEVSSEERLYNKNNGAVVRYNPLARQYSASWDTPQAQDSYLLGEPSTSNHSSFKSRITHSGDDLQNHEGDYGQSSSYTYAASSRNLLEAAEDTIEELHDEANMWERNARKLMLDLDILKEKFSLQSKKLADMEIEVSVVEKEKESMKKEVDYTKLLLEESVVRQKEAAGTMFQAQGARHIQRELEKEIKVQEESNTALALQFKRSQESNLELLSILQELEDTIEKQREEVKDLPVVRLKVNELEKSVQVYLEEKEHLLLELHQFQESEKTLQSNMQILEQSLSNKVNDLEKERSSNRKYLSDMEREFRDSLSYKEEEIVSLEEKISEYLREREEDSLEQKLETEALERKIRELERDCSELTDENLELLSRYNESKKMIKENKQAVSETSKLLSEAQKRVEDYSLKIQELESSNTKLEVTLYDLQKEAAAIRTEMAEEREKVKKLETFLQSKGEEIEYLTESCMDLEARVSDLTNEKDQLQEDMEIALTESNITSKCLDDLRNDLIVLSSSVDSHVFANKILEQKSLELEKGKCEVEVLLFKVEEENEQLSERISELEAQLRYVTDEQESTRSDLETSRSLTRGLQDEIRRLTDEMDTRERDLKRKLEDKDTRLSNAEEEYEYVKTENQKLQVSAESLIDECNALQKSYEEMRRVKMELQRHCSCMETELTETRKNLTVSSKKVETLEEKVKSMSEDFSSAEKCFTSELDVLRQENWKLNEKIKMEESLLNQMYMEKTAVIEELGVEVQKLRGEVSGLNEERERMADEAAKEVSSLHADKAELELAVKEFKSRVELIENELNSVQIDSESKIKSLTIELAVFKESYEKLAVERAKLETSLTEFQSRAELTENELQSLQTESKSKIQTLTIELSTSKESYRKLTEEIAASKQSHEKRLKLLSGYRSREDKLKTALNDLELKVTVSEYERQQLIEETTNLKSRFQKTSQLQDEVLALKRKLDESKIKEEKLEASLHSISANYEELIAEKMVDVEKISSLQKSMIELEEKLLQLEGEKDVCSKKAEAFEEILKGKQDQINSNSKKGNESGSGNESPYDEMDFIAKIELLEAELDEALNANNKYRTQLQRISSEGRNNTVVGQRKMKGEGDLVPKERYERTKSSLEKELKEIRDRYFQMSLKYAEVEAEREDLVMQLKSNKSVKRSSKRSYELSD